MRNDFKQRPRPAFRGGGIALRGMGAALRGGGIAKRGMGVALAKGGKAFPDLNKDGKVTFKDVLIGRGVIKKSKGGAMDMSEKHEGMESKAEEAKEYGFVDHVVKSAGQVSGSGGTVR